MSRNNVIIAALAGAAAAALIANYLGTERGKQLLSTASDTLKDLSGKATEFAKNNLPGVVKSTVENKEPVS
jgi:hypothetical protein